MFIIFLKYLIILIIKFIILFFFPIIYKILNKYNIIFI